MSGGSGTDSGVVAAEAAASSSSRIHVVGSDGELMSTPAQLDAWMEGVGLMQRGTGYYVVGIMGAQSSGKSTLLNLVFGTEFDMLDASTGRQMTTKGVWMGASPLVPGALIMDLEGTDSVTRGVERHPFERQSALLGLSVAEVLIINMWQHDIGRYVASNYGVLATIFEVNLELLHEQIRESSQRCKTMLMFCIRDHLESDSPLSVMASQLTADTQRIWAELKKPDGLQHLEVDDLFVIRFVALPHKKYESEQFHREVDLLRDRFTNSDNPDYLLSGSFHLQKSSSVPISGFSRYVSTIWETIRGHKDLNLPSQKEMLAIYRCDELLHEAAARFEAALQPLCEAVAAEFRETLPQEVAELHDAAIAEFEEAAAGYHQETVRRKQAELAGRLAEEVRPLVALQMKHVRDSVLLLFNEAMLKALPSDANAPAPDFEAAVQRCRDAAMARLEQMAWPGHHVSLLEDVSKALDASVKEMRAQQVALLLGVCRSRVKGLVAKVKAVLDDAAADVWSQVYAAVRGWLRQCDRAGVSTALAHLGLSDSDALDVKHRIGALAMAELDDQLTKHVAFIKMKMQKRFDSKFRLDDEGLPRKWHQEKSIRDVFVAARDDALRLLQQVREFKVQKPADEEDEEDEDNGGGSLAGMTAVFLQRLDRETLLSEEELADRRLQFLQECEISLRGAESAQARAFELARTPMWVFPLLAVLGFNEFMAVLTSPFLLLFVVVVSVAAGLIYFLNLSGPVLAMTKLGLRQASAAISAFMETALDPAPSTPPTSSPSNCSAAPSTSSTASGTRGSPVRRRVASPNGPTAGAFRE